MPAEEVTPLRDLEDAEQAFRRVQAQIEAQDPANLAAMNVDLRSATSIALGRAPGILLYRDQAAALPQFDITNFDCLVDYAKATWYLIVVNFPDEAAPCEYEAEVFPLRAKLMTWARPLALTGIFSQQAMNQIKRGGGLKDGAGDLVALVALFRAQWERVKTMCGLTEEELERAAKIGAAVFTAICRRENATVTLQEKNLRVHQAWTLLDRAYSQCRRALVYLRWDAGDRDDIAPSLRRNAGPRRAARATANQPAAPAPAIPVTPAAPGDVQGNGSGGKPP